MRTIQNGEAGSPYLLTPRAACQWLAISPRALWTLTKLGDIPVVRVGTRSVRYDPADLQRYCDARKAVSQ